MNYVENENKLLALAFLVGGGWQSEGVGRQTIIKTSNTEADLSLTIFVGKKPREIKVDLLLGVGQAIT
jgi:hypothetical protein